VKPAGESVAEERRKGNRGRDSIRAWNQPQ
jgi:hypothetical protein